MGLCVCGPPLSLCPKADSKVARGTARRISTRLHPGNVALDAAAHPEQRTDAATPQYSSPQSEIRNAPACRVPKILSQKLEPINAPTSHKVKQAPQRFQVTVHSAKDMPPEWHPKSLRTSVQVPYAVSCVSRMTYPATDTHITSTTPHIHSCQKPPHRATSTHPPLKHRQNL